MQFTWMIAGHPADSPYVVAAGFLASESQWLAFELEWNTALQRHNLGSVFHMADFERKRLKNRGVILDELTDTINRNTRTHFSAAVPMEAYRNVNNIYILEEFIGTPFSICVRSIAHNLQEWRQKSLLPNDQVLMFVESGTLHRGDMQEAFHRDRLQIPQSVPKSHPSVQAADLLAWELFHFHRTRIQRRALVKLIDGRDFVLAEIREQKLIDECKRLNMHMRKDVPPETTFSFHNAKKRKRKRTIW